MSNSNLIIKENEYMTYYIKYDDHGIYKYINIIGKNFDDVLKSFNLFKGEKEYKIVNIKLIATGYLYI